uniref:NPL domain-containing protein n=1 Tax=Schistocephalus solidus TaxID=70667 RepID=A0A183T5Y3_SCHSO
LTAAKSAIPITVLRLSEGQQTYYNLTLIKPSDTGSLGEVIDAGDDSSDDDDAEEEEGAWVEQEHKQ